MVLDSRVAGRYEVYDEDERLWTAGRGELIRLRTWDIFARYLPPGGRLLDVGGGPGTHAAQLAGRGYQVTLVEPVARHRGLAARRARGQARGFDVVGGEARRLPVGDESVDVVLAMGPLYHLMERSQRLEALQEARRVLPSGGVLLAEAISRYAWVLDASARDLLDTPGIWENFAWNLQGFSQDPDDKRPGEFWAYFHHPDELRQEVIDAGFVDVELTAVEGFGRLLGGLEARMTDPDLLLRAIRLVEQEPSMLGVSAHFIATASRP